jgi:plastocyanin
MRNLLSLAALILLLLPGLESHSSAAELNGRVLVIRKLTKKRVTLPVYHLRGASPVLDRDLPQPVNQYSELAVFLEGNSSDAGKPVRVELRQEGQQFVPRLLVVPVGSTVSFPNGDPVFHNVFSLSGAKKFDLGYYPAGQTRVVKFDEPGVVQVYCHLHPNMYAAVVVAPNRWYAQPGDDGTFSLHDVPPGTYTLVTWHMNAGYFRKPIRVSSEPSTDVLLDIPIRDEARHP